MDNNVEHSVSGRMRPASLIEPRSAWPTQKTRPIRGPTPLDLCAPQAVRPRGVYLSLFETKPMQKNESVLPLRSSRKVKWFVHAHADQFVGGRQPWPAGTGVSPAGSGDGRMQQANSTDC